MDSLIITPTEAARRLRTNTLDVYKKLESGEIPAYRDGSAWKIPRQLLEQYVIERALEESKQRRYIDAEINSEL